MWPPLPCFGYSFVHVTMPLAYAMRCEVKAELLRSLQHGARQTSIPTVTTPVLLQREELVVVVVVVVAVAAASS